MRPDLGNRTHAMTLETWPRNDIAFTNQTYSFVLSIDILRSSGAIHNASYKGL